MTVNILPGIEPEPGRLEASAGYLHWSYLTLAVLSAFEDNVRLDQAPGTTGLGRSEFQSYGRPKANADTWAWHSYWRDVLVLKVRTSWCHMTGLDLSWWPYSEDAVARLYLRFRKRNAGEVAAMREEASRAVLGRKLEPK